MPVKIIDNTSKIIGDSKVNGSIFLRTMADEIDKIARPNTPKLFGDLRNNIIKSILGLSGKIKWAQVYASYQERGRRADGSHVVRKYTSGGGAHFAENAVNEAVGRTGSIAKQAGIA